MISKEYIKAIIKRILNQSEKDIKKNVTIQELYDENDYYQLLSLLEEYNISKQVPLLACGMSCYFNDQVAENGLSELKVNEEDKKDAKYIASCFGKSINYSETDLSILYMTLLGTTEFNYGMQTFPAGIFEDVFQCSADHSLPLDFIAGESEVDYYCRVLDYQISKHSNFPTQKRDEVIMRGRRLASKFCNGKNRIYLIPSNNVLDNKASFGDADGLRNGAATGEALETRLSELHTLRELLEAFNISINDYSNANLTGEFGIAIYGKIKSDGITFIEVTRMYDLIQEKARSIGYKEGEIIPNNFDCFQEEKLGHSRT